MLKSRQCLVFLLFDKKLFLKTPP